MANFVFLAQQPMDVPIGSNAVDIAYEVSKDHNILYVNIPADRITALRNKPEDRAFLRSRTEVRKKRKKALQRINDRLWQLTPGVILESINTLPDGRIYDLLNRRNNRLLAGEINTALRELAWDHFYIFNDSEMFRGYYMKELLKPDGMIYYSRDNLREVDYFKKHGRRLEPLLMAKSDLCVSNSAYLRDKCAEHNPDSFDIGQGCDLTMFDPGTEPVKPEVFQQHKGPYIGYVGALLSLRLDIPLLEKVAASQPDWRFILVGPEDQEFISSKLHQMPNVVFTGPCEPQLAPAYMAHFDVCLNPQRIHPMTIGNYPRKIDEYLAMGKPTVATETQAMKMFSEHVYLGSSPEDYLRLIRLALDENSEEKAATRRTFALGHSWTNSVSALYKAMDRSGLPL